MRSMCSETKWSLLQYDNPNKKCTNITRLGRLSLGLTFTALTGQKLRSEFWVTPVLSQECQTRVIRQTGTLLSCRPPDTIGCPGRGRWVPGQHGSVSRGLNRHSGLSKNMLDIQSGQQNPALICTRNTTLLGWSTVINSAMNKSLGGEKLNFTQSRISAVGLDSPLCWWGRLLRGSWPCFPCHDCSAVGRPGDLYSWVTPEEIHAWR